VALRSYIVALGLAGIGVVATAGVAVAHTGALNDWPYAANTGQVTTYTLAAVGDIACEPDDAENAGTPAALKCGSDQTLVANWDGTAWQQTARPDLAVSQRNTLDSAHSTSAGEDYRHVRH
jgi:hypothetical protein